MRKILSWLLSAAMCLSLIATAAPTVQASGSFDAEFNVNTGEESGTGYTITSPDFRITENGSYLLEGTGQQTSSYRIRVDTGVTATVTLKNVNLLIALPFECGANSKVTLILADDSENRLESNASYHAGIRVHETASLTITTEGQDLGNGSLKAYGCGGYTSGYGAAGIGGGQFETSGAIVIDGGTIFAKGGDGRSGTYGSPGAAGIGGGCGGSCGEITINGGTVTAIAGGVKASGAGIGGGSSDPSRHNGKITINNGTVRAYSGEITTGDGTPGIGFCSEIAIANTADVKAYSSGIYSAIAGTAAETGHGAYLLNLMLDEAVTQDTDITVTRADGSPETFEMTLPKNYNNLAANVSGANDYFANLADGTTYVAHLSDGNPAFTGVLTAPEATLDPIEASLVALPGAFDISEGTITIADGTATGTYKVTYGASQTADNIPQTQTITLTGSGAAHAITVAATTGTVKIRLDGISVNSITLTASDIRNVEVILQDGTDNVIATSLKNESGPYGGGMTVACEHYGEEGHICDDTCGSLTASGSGCAPGIWGDNTTINGGNISATSGFDAPGIGNWRNSSNIIIQGGKITSTGRSAYGGGGAAGIGGSDIGSADGIYINGGIVNATGAAKSSGIGGGVPYSGGGGQAHNIIISGGTVKATSGGAGIGGSGACSNIQINGGSVNAKSISIQPVNANGDNVYLTTITFSGAGAWTRVSDLQIVGADYFNQKDIFTDDAEKIYLYLPAGARVTGATAGDRDYEGSVTTTDNNAAAAIFTVSAPVLQSAATSRDGETVILTFDKDMSSPSGDAAQFAVIVNDSLRPSTSEVLDSSDAKKIVLTLPVPVAFGDTVTVNYPPFGNITSTDGGALASFADQAVTNTVSAPMYALTAGAVYRASAESATVKLTSNTAGDYYYCVSESATAPAIGNLIGWEFGGTLAADTSVSLTAIGLSSGAQYIHVVVVNDEGDVSTPITFDIPCDYYCWENFESYPLDTTLTSGDFSPLKAKHNGSGAAYQKVIQGTEGNTSQVLTLTSSSGTAADADISLGSDFASSGKTYAVEFKAQPISGGWPGEVRILTGEGRGTFTNALGVEFRGGKIGSYITDRDYGIQPLGNYTLDQWYHVKIIVNTQTKKYNIYVDGVQLADNLEAIGDYTYLNITAGHSCTIRFDDLKIYETDPIMPDAPLLQSAETSTDGGKIILTFDKEMEAPDGEHSQFSVTAGGNTNEVTAAALGTDAKTIELTLATAVIYEQTVTVSYTEGMVASSDGGALASFSDQAVTNTVPMPTYALAAPASIAQNGVTAAVTFSPASPVAAGTSVMATVTLTGTAAAAGTHTIDLTSVKAGLTADPKTETVTAEQDLTTTPINKTFHFTMPAEVANDFVLTHTFSAVPPVLQSAVTSADGKTVVLTFDKDMSSPTGDAAQFAVVVNGSLRPSISEVLDSADAKKIVLTLPSPVAYGDTVTVHYPSGGNITSTDGGTLAPFANQAVTNNVPTAPPPSGGEPTPSAPVYKADVKTGDSTQTPIPVTVDEDAGSASADIDSGQLTSDGTVITMPSIPHVDTYTVGIPVPDLSTADAQGSLTIETSNGSITVPSNMLTGAENATGDKAQISIGAGDKASLPESVKTAIGDRPLIQLTLSIDGKQTDWSNPGAPVTVSIPYTPTAAELENPESIVVWYIDGAGNVVTVPNGRYDAATGMVTFRTTHFSDYAVAYNKVDFNDVAADAWYGKAVSFLAAREITKGTGGGNYSPETRLTRGELIVLLMRAYGIKPDSDPIDNFSDAGDTWYTGYLATAKRLKISAGVGNNMYAPENPITRQEMFTLLYNALKVIGQLSEGDSGRTLADFTDAANIAPWANEAMTLLVKTGAVAGSGGMLMPTGTTSRAEMAQVLYNSLMRQ